jgi:hypothetical protein
MTKIEQIMQLMPQLIENGVVGLIITQEEMDLLAKKYCAGIEPPKGITPISLDFDYMGKSFTICTLDSMKEDDEDDGTCPHSYPGECAECD